MYKEKPTSTPYIVREGAGVFHIVRPWDEKTRSDREPTFGSGLGAHIADLQFHVGAGVATKEKAKANADFLVLSANAHPDLVDLAKRFRVFLDNVPGCSDLDCKQSLCTAIRADRLQIETVLAHCGEEK